MIREWLRLLANENVTPEQLNVRHHDVKMTDFVAKIRNTVQKWRGEYDFSHEVKAAMDTCLACKACASQCPIKIDVPNFRAKFFHFTMVVIYVLLKITLSPMSNIWHR